MLKLSELGYGSLKNIPIPEDEEYKEPAYKIYEALDCLYDDLTYNVTRIFGRHDLLLAVDLTYHSVISFRFQGQLLDRGWIEIIVPGDTRTGKSTILKRLVDHYGWGELISGENVSFAGVVGGIDDANERKFVRWGLFPRNDRGFVAIDECQEMDPSMIVKLSSVRSSGIAEIYKIRSLKARARVRSVWIANPRNAKYLAEFAYGIESVKDIVGKPEDIARFDICVTAALNDVPDSVLNVSMKDVEPVDHSWSSDLANLHLRFAWTREADNIRFTDEAESAILKFSERLGKEFDSSLPIVIRAEQRIKLARLSVALAVRVFSVEDMKDVIVKPEHVVAIYYYLKWVYSKESCGYDRYSATMRRDDLDYTKVKEKFKNYDKQSIELLLNTRAITQRICHIITGNKDVGEALQRWMFLNRCVYLDGSAPLKDKKFSDLLRRLVVDPDIKEVADEELPGPSGSGVDLDGEAQGWQAQIEFE